MTTTQPRSEPETAPSTEPGAGTATYTKGVTTAQTHSDTQTQSEPLIFYTKEGCPWCNAVRHLLDEHGVPYEEREVLGTPQHLESLRRETEQEKTPTLKIAGQWMMDTDAKEVATRLGLPEPAAVELAS